MRVVFFLCFAVVGFWVVGPALTEDSSDSESVSINMSMLYFAALLSVLFWFAVFSPYFIYKHAEEKGCLKVCIPCLLVTQLYH